MPGSYVCKCNDGYSRDGSFVPSTVTAVAADGDGCYDIDECSTDPSTCNGGENAQCINEEGSYFCQCNDGYSASADDADVCIDIDECTTDPSACNGGNNAECINSEGSYFC